MKRLFKNGPLAEDKRTMSQAQSLSQVEQFFGSLQTFSVLSTKPLGTKTCYLVGVLEYANGPAFIVVTYFSGNRGITSTSMFFKTEPESLFPSELLMGPGNDK